MIKNGFSTENGILKKYYGIDSHVVIPDDITVIGESAFMDCIRLTSVRIPDSVKEIRKEAFKGCRNLTKIVIPENMAVIEDGLFSECSALSSVKTGQNVERIGSQAFWNCRSLKSFVIPDSVKEIGDGAFKSCGLSSVIIPDGISKISDWTFCLCSSLNSVTIPDSVTEIGDGAFESCSLIRSLSIPNGVVKIGRRAFFSCRSLITLTIPEKITEIQEETFSQCTSLSSLVLSDRILYIGERVFSDSPGITIICHENTQAHRYCVENSLRYLFDFQFEAFHGMIPPGIERLSSPFLADEKKPFIFISYSHKDREEVLGIIKTLYESGWKIWYDEGLTIGDKYDETLESHVRNCSAFLLFVTKNSLNSLYCRENEIPWAVQYGKPIVKCILDRGTDYEIDSSSVAATVLPSDIEPALERISGLEKGENRIARGISVAVNPAARDKTGSDGFAYCLYAEKNASTAQAILHEAKSSGCVLYDAQKEGSDEKRFQSCGCLIVFLDHAFLSDSRLTQMLTETYQAGRDLAICQLEEIQDEDLPPELVQLHLMQWLNFVHGITSDMVTKLARHLEKRGCRKTETLPGFEYSCTEKGITLRKYTGTSPNPVIEREYFAKPVVEIADETFINCSQLTAITIPGSVIRIGRRAFHGCTNLASVIIPDSVTEIGPEAFRNCTCLTTIRLPSSISIIKEGTFAYSGLTSLTVPDSVATIEGTVFLSCKNLKTLVISNSVKHVGHMAFSYCEKLTLYCPPDSCTWNQFRRCAGLEVKPLDKLNHPGFFHRVFGKK